METVLSAYRFNTHDTRSKVAPVFGHIMTVNDACTRYGVSLRNVWKLIGEQGMTLEEAVLNLIDNDTIEFEHEKYPSFTFMCNVYSVQCATVRRRVINGWSMHDAVYTPVRTMRKSNILYMQDRYGSIIELCREYGIQYNLVSSLAQKLNYYPIETFHILHMLKDILNISNDLTLSKIPLCIINDSILFSHKELSNYLKVPESAVLKIKTDCPNADLIELLNRLKRERVYTYAINGVCISAGDLKELIGSKAYNEIKEHKEYKIPHAKYPNIQNIDFDNLCIDVRYTLKYIIDKYDSTRSWHFGNNCDRFKIEHILG